MTDQSEYVPPKIWTWDKDSGGRFANINRPIAHLFGIERLSVRGVLFQTVRTDVKSEFLLLFR